jgi:hypothetical protein
MGKKTSKPQSADIKPVVDVKKVSMTTKNREYIDLLTSLSMKGASSTETSSVNEELFDTVKVSVEQVERKVKDKTGVEKDVKMLSFDCVSADKSSSCVMKMHTELEGITQEKLPFMIDDIKSVLDRLQNFGKEHDILMTIDRSKITLKNLNTGMQSWIPNSDNSDLAKMIKGKLEKCKFEDDYGIKFADIKIGEEQVKYVVSPEQLKISSGFIIKGSLLKNVLIECRSLKNFMIPIEMGSDASGRFVKITIETDKGGFDKIFRDNEITFVGDKDAKFTSTFGIGIDSIVSVAKDSFISCVYAQDSPMVLFTHVNSWTDIIMLIGPRALDDDGDETVDDKKEGVPSKDENGEDLEEAIAESLQGDEKDSDEGEDGDIDKLLT